MNYFIYFTLKAYLQPRSLGSLLPALRRGVGGGRDGVSWRWGGGGDKREPWNPGNEVASEPVQRTILLVCPSNSKVYGKEPRYNETPL